MCDEGLVNLDQLLDLNKPNQGMVDSTKALTAQIKKYGADNMPSDFMTKNELDFLLEGPYTDEELKAIKDKEEMTALSTQELCEKLGISETDVAALINEFNYDRGELVRDEASQVDVTLLLAVLKLLKGTSGKKAVEILGMANYHIKNEIEQAQRDAEVNYTIGNKHE